MKLCPSLTLVGESWTVLKLFHQSVFWSESLNRSSLCVCATGFFKELVEGGKLVPQTNRIVEQIGDVPVSP